MVRDFRDSFRDFKNRAQVRLVSFPRRSRDGGENDLAFRQYFRDVGCKAQSAVSDPFLHEFLQARFINGAFPALAFLYFLLVYIDSANLMPEFREAGGGNQSNVAGSYYRDFHITLLIVFRFTG